jgi:hypothetical protein
MELSICNDHETPLSPPSPPKLPNDALACVLSQLDSLKQLKQLARVCKQWNEVSCRHDVQYRVVQKLFCCRDSFEAFTKPPFDLVKMRAMFNAVSDPSISAFHRSCTSDSVEDEETFSPDMSHRWPVFASFDDMHLRESLLRGVYAYGFEKPSRVQTSAGNKLV